MIEKTLITQTAIAYLKPTISDDSTAIQLAELDFPALIPVNDELCISFVKDDGDRFLFIKNNDLKIDGISMQELQAFGLTNLEQIARQHLKIQQYQNIYIGICDGHFEASMILIDTLWEIDLRNLVKRNFAVAIPARDILAFCDSESELGIKQLKEIIQKLVDADHKISTNIFERINSKWTPKRETISEME
jgi:uncharacterized protein YtpQ (UPF0354 family)